MDQVVVNVPASTSNLGPGFDTIGMALSLYTTITMSKSEQTDIIMADELLKTITKLEDNLVYQGAKIVFEKAGVDHFPLKLEISSDIPLKRGLGSSGAAIIGGMMGANALLGTPFSKDEIFQMAAKLEGHPDNVSAALFGGVMIAAKSAAGTYSYVKLAAPPELRAVVAIPEIELSTKKMRAVLPSSYTKEDTVFAVNHVALFVAALATRQIELLHDAMQDTLHQPYRSKFVPCLDRLMEEGREHGAFGVALSGAGPTIVALATDRARELARFMMETYEEQGIQAEIKILTVDDVGATVEKGN